MSSELRELRAESAELRKRTDELQRTASAEPTRPEPKERESVTRATERVSNLASAKVENDSEDFAGPSPEHEPKPVKEPSINAQDASLGNSFESRRITELPLNTNNVIGLLSLQPGVSPRGYVRARRTDQTNITLDGVDPKEPPSQGREFDGTFSLIPSTVARLAQVEMIVDIPRYRNWIRLELHLEGAAQHTDYHLVIQASDGRSVFSVDWIEPLTPNQTIIETPVIPTSQLSSRDYKLTLTATDGNGIYLKVGEYTFRVLRN
jgi:hypothetical protein